MDVDDIRKFCRSQLARHNWPSAIELEDCVQEYCLAELEERDGAAAVNNYIGQCVKDAGNYKRTNLAGHASPDHDVEDGDEAIDEAKYIEEEIVFEANAERAKPIYQALCDHVPHDRADVFKRYFGIQKPKEGAADIADSLGWSHYQVNDCVNEVIRVLQSLLKGKKEAMPLFQMELEVRKDRERAWRKVKKPDNSMPMVERMAG